MFKLFSLAIVAAGLIGLATTGEANAAPVYKKTVVVQRNGYHGYHHNHHRHHHHNRTVVVTKTYYRDYGVPFKGGYYFTGRHHNHWGHRTWNVQYNRYHYYEPTLQVYYYYCPVQEAYYPCD